ncbi:putative bifunctional diguanylate cyclase/phosphodiesterase [Burkholderia sp. 8Y]|uniref:putative bifunctional diguanylate cyclase/phosphodiesterase n=1 Tax=Burkholderia sp. 8Y TaxID=2653133 RepID=UPI001F22FDBD|nr:GGDEF and EAL domain-containing protein [Burkholderia sp. 8Y]
MNKKIERSPAASNTAADEDARQAVPPYVSVMLDSLTDAFVSFDPTWRITYVNATAERILRRPRRELLGFNAWDCFPDLVGSGYYETYHEAVASGQPRSFTGYYDRFAAWIEVRAFPHEDGLTVLLRDVSRERGYTAELEYQATHDHTTGLLNRRQCMAVLSSAVAQASSMSTKSDTCLAILFLDLDRFKEVNDAFGHSAGDVLLHDIGERLRALASPDVFVARMGGDEFVLVASNTGEASAEKLARLALSTLARPFDVRGRMLSIGASIGIAIRRHGGESAETLLNQADAAMYAAKSAGRFQVRVYHRELGRRLDESLPLCGDIQDAFRNNQFELHFQPQVRTADGLLCGAEALLRWRHPEHGLLSPAAFLDSILESPMVGALTEWVVGETCRHVAKWLAGGRSPQRVSFNLSARQLIVSGLAGTIVELAQRHGVPPSMLEVEVTENSLVTDIDEAARILGALKEAGLSTSLDDFGSGYSSLAYLVRLPIDRLKIDKSFVWAMEKTPNALGVINAIIALGRSLGMETIAEGVETEAQREMLAAQGCDTVQGYLISRPLDADRFAAFLRA